MNTPYIPISSKQKNDIVTHVIKTKKTPQETGLQVSAILSYS
jgi:hypothetical protein